MVLLALAGCGGTTPEASESPHSAAPRDETSVEVIREEPPPETPAEAPREPALVKGVSSRVGTEAPDVRILEPRKNAVVKHGPFRVKLAVKNWPTAPRGPYVAVALDDQAPIRVEDVAAPVDLGEVAEGSHLVRAYAALGSGEAIDDGHGYAAVVFHVGNRTADWGFDATKPHLTLNWPSGTYTGDAAAAILLDVLVTNAAAGMKAKVTVGDAISAEMTEWVPHHLHDLPDGLNAVTVELFDPAGAPVPGPFGRATRIITVSRGATEAPAAE